jgi:hypothetical protein
MGCVAPTCTGCCGPRDFLRVRGGRAEDLKAALQDVQVRSQEGVAHVAAQKQRLETQLANVRTMFELGDLSKEEYIELRGELIRQRDGLRETDEWEAVLARAGAFLSDLPAAWRVADGAQRNALSRMLFAQIRIKVDWVAAVEPQPSFAPFFTWDRQVRRLSGGSDGSRIRTFRTFRVSNGASPFWTSVRVPHPICGGHRGVTRSHTLAIAPALANLEWTKRPRSAPWPRPGVCADWPPSSRSATKRSALWCDKLVRRPDESPGQRARRPWAVQAVPRLR